MEEKIISLYSSSPSGLQPELQSRVQPGQLQPELLQQLQSVPSIQSELQPDTCHWSDVQPPAAATTTATTTAATAELQPAVSAGTTNVHFWPYELRPLLQ